MKKAKISYRENMVDDIKNTHPSQWYSKVRRMSGLQKDQNCSVFVDELAELTDKDQAQKIADFFSSTRNLYRRVEYKDFPEFTNQNCQNFAENLVTPKNIEDVIKNLNQKSSCIFDDLPMKIINCLSTELSKPLCNIINSIFELGSYPQIWKREVITPVPKSYPAPTINKLRPISGILNFAKVADKLIADLITSDMSESKDNYQYGNQKGLSVNHYLINMINTILKSVDKNSQSERMSTLLTMVDWSQAFERQSHVLGIESFIKNGVRKSLIPVLISFFQDREILVKWKKVFSSLRRVNGGGPQGGTAGILEYISLTTGNLDFLEEDERFKFIDDASFLETLNLLAIGLASFNFKQNIPSDIAENSLFIPTENLKTQEHLNKISQWTDKQEMKLNTDKTKYMLINFCKSLEFNTRIYLNNSILEQVKQTKLLGVIISDNMTWHANTAEIVNKSQKRMIILRKLCEFKIPVKDMIQIYILYIRSLVEQSSVVWASSITQQEKMTLRESRK